MSRHTPTTIAAFVGVVMVSTLALLSHRAHRPVHGELRLLEQRNLAICGPFTGAPPGVYLRIEEPTADSSQTIVRTKVVDAANREVPSQKLEGWLWLPFGYATPPTGVRLTVDLYAYIHNTPGSGMTETYVSKVEELPLKPLPPSQTISLTPSADAPFRLQRAKGGVIVVPKREVSREETWTLWAEATDHARSLQVEPSDRRSVPKEGFWGERHDFAFPSPFKLPIPYPEETRVARVELMVERAEEKSEIVRLAGLRLVQRQGETVFDLASPLRIASQFSAPLILSSPALQTRVSRSDHLHPMLVVAPTKRPAVAPEIAAEILSPSPESLGVRSLRIGPALRNATGRLAPRVSSTPFTAVLRLRRRNTASLSTRIYTVDIEHS